MKKYILILFALTCSMLGAHAMNLKEAYNALSNLPEITTELNDTITVSINHNVIENSGIMKVAGAHNLNGEDIKTVGNATFAILNQIPLPGKYSSRGFLCKRSALPLKTLHEPEPRSRAAFST